MSLKLVKGPAIPEAKVSNLVSGFEVLTAVVMISTIFCSACHLLSRWLPVRLFFDIENGDDMFLRNVG
jgi:hypothetical protein